MEKKPVTRDKKIIVVVIIISIPNNKQDTIIGDDKQGTCMLIDTAIPGDRNVNKKGSREDFKM
jgi:hypothetical protein